MTKRSAISLTWAAADPNHYLGFSTALARLSCTIENRVSLDQATAICAGRPQKCEIKVNRLGFTPQENDRMQPAAEYDRI